ncbi:polyphosphate kinase 2 family protein [Niallia sp. Krafla_26]|uniref:polyphosphate kinase 2 family protein n=1 Tax=Niallia sp. Krafla_26 TaxID=3064703 RepID=UPI003D17EB56
MSKKRLEEVDLSKKESDMNEYETKLRILQWHLLHLQNILRENKMATIIVMEGWDAAGKGGVIKRITEYLDPRGFQVWAISDPEPHEKRYHYLQRFWRKIPQYGQITIFDRSWYGRVLVERIEGFAKENEWSRAYDEINQFEKLLTKDHYIMVKFWLHINKKEQLKRFKKRVKHPLKRWKLTDEDWRNREKWEQYEEAAEEMFAKTDLNHAPWHIIPSNNKKYARLKTITIMIESIEHELEKRRISVPSYKEK